MKYNLERFKKAQETEVTILTIMVSRGRKKPMPT